MQPSTNFGSCSRKHDFYRAGACDRNGQWQFLDLQKFVVQSISPISNQQSKSQGVNMGRVQFRLFLLCFVAVINFVPLSATAQQMWHVWRKIDGCSMTRNDWLTVAQQPPGPGWVLCNGSKAHFTQLGAQQEMDILKVVQCNADMPNCPRFQNDCCDVKIWQNTQTGATTIMGNGESPGFGWQLSALNSPTQCCEEAALSIGSLVCRQTQLMGQIAVFQGPGVFTNAATGALISPAALPPPNSTVTPGHEPPITVELPEEIAIEEIPDDDDGEEIEEAGESSTATGTLSSGQTTGSNNSGQNPCGAADAETFSQMTGSWHWYRMNVTIGGSCNNVSGTFLVTEWCAGVDDPGNQAPKVQGTFTGRMEGGSLQLNWEQPPHKNHPTKGTGSCSLYGDELSCSGFGCAGELKRQ
jgi:hypothetical protein